MKTVVTGFLCLYSAFAQAGSVHEFQGIHRLDLKVASGDVKITGVEGDTASVDVVKKRYDERCLLKIEQHGDALFVELATRSLFSARCQADFDIRLPKEVALKMKTGSGDLRVRDTTGPVELIAGSGQIQVDAKVREFEAKLGSGSLRVQGLESHASVKTGSGHVRLVYSKVPVDGSLDIRSGSGDAEVLFPPRAKVKTKFTAGSGMLKNLLGESADARFTVSMKTGSGDLTVGKF